MNFKNSKPIYQQIVDLCFAQILSGAWAPEGKVPSVRELAAELIVNTHTVLKAFDYLQNEGIIVSRRGLGFFLAPDAKERIHHAQKEEFFKTTLPEIIRTMELLGITPEEIISRLPSTNN